MALKLLTNRTMPIGIDLGTSALKLAQLRRAEHRLELVAAGAAEVPEGCQDDLGKRLDFVSHRLRALLKGNGFRTRKCVVSIPAAATVVQHVKIARMLPAEIDKALRWELEGKLPFASANAIIRHMVAGDTYADGKPGLEIIVVAASREMVEAHLEVARRCKMTVLALNVEPCAILECFARLFRRSDDHERVTLFLDFGQACTQVVIGHGPRMAFARNLMLGARQMDEMTGASLKVPVAEVQAARRRLRDAPDPSPQAERVYAAMGEALENVVAEITKCLRYYESVFPANPIERAIFLGGQALDRRLCQGVARRLELPAQIGDPLARIGGSGQWAGGNTLDRRKAQPAWAVAVGLSLGADLPQAA